MRWMPHPGKHGGVDAVGLGEVQRPRKMPGMQRVEAAHRLTGARSLPQQKPVAAAGRLEDRQVFGRRL